MIFYIFIKFDNKLNVNILFNNFTKNNMVKNDIKVNRPALKNSIKKKSERTRNPPLKEHDRHDPSSVLPGRPGPGVLFGGTAAVEVVCVAPLQVAWPTDQIDTRALNTGTGPGVV